MTISRKWWEPAPDEHLRDSEGQPRPSFDLDSLLSLSIGGGEFGHLAELLCSAGCGRQPAHRLPPGNALASDQRIL